MSNKITCFEDLIVWQKAQDVAVKIYKLAEKNDFINKHKPAYRRQLCL